MLKLFVSVVLSHFISFEQRVPEKAKQIPPGISEVFQSWIQNMNESWIIILFYFTSSAVSAVLLVIWSELTFHVNALLSVCAKKFEWISES